MGQSGGIKMKEKKDIFDRLASTIRKSGTEFMTEEINGLKHEISFYRKTLLTIIDKAPYEGGGVAKEIALKAMCLEENEIHKHCSTCTNNHLTVYTHPCSNCSDNPLIISHYKKKNQHKYRCPKCGAESGLIN
jgi:predicted RNA-binding Zn-ribbon protein involved in translation (DUF1610 family)